MPVSCFYFVCIFLAASWVLLLFTFGWRALTLPVPLAVSAVNVDFVKSFVMNSVHSELTFAICDVNEDLYKFSFPQLWKLLY